jgi:6-phospho-beta-glucosidase
MERLCPNAWLINFTNPASMVTEAVQRFSTIRCIGLCNAPVGLEKAVAKLLGNNNFTLICAGLNHYLYGKHIYYKGRDVLTELLPKLINEENSAASLKNIPDEQWNVDFIKELALIPAAYHRYYYMTDAMLSHQLEDYKQNRVRAEVVKRVEERLLKLYADPNLTEKPKELEERGGAYYSDAACNLIQSLYTNDYRRMVVNVPNNGTIVGLPDDATIETSAIITNAGAVPLKTDAFSPFVQAQLVLQKTFERLTIEAAMTGNYEVAIQALTLNPLVRKGYITRQVLNETIKANAKYLPKWKIRE